MTELLLAKLLGQITASFPFPDVANQNPNIVAFSRGLLIEKDQKHTYSEGRRNDLETTTLQAELMKLGFMLDQAAFMHLTTWKSEDAVRYFNDVLPVAKELVGTRREDRGVHDRDATGRDW